MSEESRLYQCLRPQGLLGVASGVGGGYHPPYPAFTGKDVHGQLWYRGARWYGPTNKLGYMPVIVRTENGPALTSL